MKIVITEEQYQEIIKESIIKDTLKDLKINSTILFTFGTGMAAFMGPVKRMLEGSGFNLNENEVAFLIISSVAILLNDASKGELVKKVEEKGLTKALEGTKELINNVGNIIKSVTKTLLGVSYSLGEILGFSLLLKPVMDIIGNIINDRGITTDNVSMLLKGVVLAGIVFSLRNIVNKIKNKLSDDKVDIKEDIEPSENAIKSICDSKKICSAQGKITFGQLRELVESAKTRRLQLHIGEGGYKAFLRLLPWFIPQLALAGFTGSLIRAANKILKPTLEETTNYKTWWGKLTMKLFNLVEGELGVNDPLSRIFFISDGLLTMLDDKQKVKFARYIAEVASEKPDDEEVPEFFVENELRKWLNEKFLLDPPLQSKTTNLDNKNEHLNESFLINESFVRLSEKEIEDLYSSLNEMGFVGEDVEYELNNLIDYYDNLPSTLKLYRIVFSNSIDDIDTQYPGYHYSNNKKNLINNHYDSLRDSSYGDNPYLIEVKVEKQMIDYYESIKNNILYPNEEEITLKNKGFGAEIIKITPVFY